MSHLLTEPRRTGHEATDDWEGAVCAQVGSVEAERMFFPTGPNQGVLDFGGIA